MAAITAFRDYGTEPTIEQTGRYVRLWSMYDGSWMNHPAIRRQHKTNPKLYRHTKLIWSLARAVTRLYAQTVYMGDLSTDGKPLPDGTRGAIPIDGQTGDETLDATIQVACAELWAMWNWRQFMSYRPKMAAVLGDCLTELVDDVERGKVLPKTIWPGYVTDLELDLVGNVKAYAIEYLVTVESGTKFGRTIAGETYTYRKEVDQQTFRYYRDGKPFDYYGEGAVAPNPYGFVPAIWDRHEIVWGDRGAGAFEGALQAMQEINSVFSHALDYQQKQFGAPIGIKGSTLGSRGGAKIVLPGGGEPDTAKADDLDLLPMGPEGDFLTVNFDIGKTVEMVKFLQESLTAEFPEARYAQEILQMTQLTAPGVERALGPIISNVKAARANQDPQTVKLHQMAIAIMGYRLKQGDYPAQIVTERPARYAAFAPFDLGSYGRGQLDFGIPDRPVISETPAERIAMALQLQAIDDPYFLNVAGIPEEDVIEIMRRREERRAQMFEAQERRFNAGLDAPEEDEEGAA